MSEQHRIDIAIFPFWEDVPSEIAIFRPQHKPVLAWEREARLKGRASKHKEVNPKWPNRTKIRSRRPLEERISQQEEVLIVICSFLIHLTSKNVILKPKLCPELAPRGPKKSQIWPRDGRMWSQAGPQMAQRWPEDGPCWPSLVQDGPKYLKDGPNVAEDGPKIAEGGPKMAQDGPNMAQDGPRWAQEASR